MKHYSASSFSYSHSLVLRIVQADCRKCFHRLKILVHGQAFSDHVQLVSILLEKRNLHIHSHLVPNVQLSECQVAPRFDGELKNSELLLRHGVT